MDEAHLFIATDVKLLEQFLLLYFDFHDSLVLNRIIVDLQAFALSLKLSPAVPPHFVKLRLVLPFLLSELDLVDDIVALGHNSLEDQLCILHRQDLRIMAAGWGLPGLLDGDAL